MRLALGGRLHDALEDGGVGLGEDAVASVLRVEQVILHLAPAAKQFRLRQNQFLDLERVLESELFPALADQPDGEQSRSHGRDHAREQQFVGLIDAAVNRVPEQFLVSISGLDRKSTRLNSSHANISYAVFCLKK